ncbi:MmgE/PrpD family protein [Ruegeria sp. SCP11]|uniref:MmgE/PrpD family protein n=1 Tax=Ruegeria sp. SCP11 TaxID=3141378 RepID=UPI003337EB9F
MTAIAQIARFATSAQLNRELTDVIAPAVADCFGCILAGANSEVAKRTATALADQGAGSAQLYGCTRTVSPLLAAQMNAVAGHVWDLDDWEEPGNTHPTVVMLPALLAASHIHPSSGADLLAAYAVGSEIIMRLGEAVSLDHYARGFHSTATLGTIGAAGACARLLRLTESQTVHALALSVSLATGYSLQFGSNAKPLQAGWAARGGLEAALLAAQGLAGQAHVLDHARGFAGLMGNYDANRFEHRMDRLGTPWALQEYGLILKPWPSCGYTHRLMTAALDLRDALADRLSEITSIHAQIPDFHAEILPFMNPATRNEALFSAPACIAQILSSGNLTLEDSASEFWRRRDVSRLIALTSITAEPAQRPEMNYDPAQPDVLTVTLSTGEVLQASCATPLGAAQSPMTLEQLGAKFAALTGKPESAFDSVFSWPDAPDIATFFRGESL